MDYNYVQDNDQDNDHKNNNCNDQDDQNNQDQIHPNKIARLAQNQKEKVNQEENQDQDQKHNPNPQQHQDQSKDENVDGKFEQDNKIEIKFENDNDPEMEQEQEQVDPQFDCLIRTRSGKVSRQVHKYEISHQSNLQTQATDLVKYSIKTSKVIAQTISVMSHQFAQTYSLIKGIKAFGNKGHQPAHNEMKQLHNHIVFTPILVEELTTVKQKSVMESLIFLTEKNNGRIKARTCAN